MSSGSVYQRIGNDAKNGPIVFMDPDQKIVGLHLYDGQLRITSIVGGNFCHFFNVHMDEKHILDMCFLSASHFHSNLAVLAVLYEDTNHVRHLRTYVVDTERKEIEDGPWPQPSRAHSAEMLIPIHAYGGLLLVGESMIYYLSSHEQGRLAIPVPETTFRCYAKVDDNRYLLSDHSGSLYVLVLNAPDRVVKEVSCQRLGENAARHKSGSLDALCM